jgi:fatty-acyl-CoA synthase
MATIVSDNVLDLAAFREHLVARLPDYARPLFLRMRSEIEITSTFKHKKSDLVRDGYDPAATTDPIYFHDSRRQAFVPLDQALHERIACGQMRL